MAIEIERKFLLNGDFRKYIKHSVSIIQGYLSRVAERTVRVRICNKKAYLTIKGKANKSGLSRYEFETEIPYNEALEILELCEKGIIEKTRHIIEYKGHTFEVDEFSGANKGLVIAEIELSSENETFEKPVWIGEDVTHDIRYSNSYLGVTPYSTWK